VSFLFLYSAEWERERHCVFMFVSFLSKFSVSFFLSPFARKVVYSANSKHALYENLICVHVLLLCLFLLLQKIQMYSTCYTWSSKYSKLWKISWTSQMGCFNAKAWQEWAKKCSDELLLPFLPSLINLYTPLYVTCMMIDADTSRHYQPLESIKRVIDSMSFAKLVSSLSTLPGHLFWE
jgi:hypothetical protein